jgi:hypothetical protein
VARSGHFPPPRPARNNEDAADELERRLDRLAAANAAYAVPEKAV